MITLNHDAVFFKKKKTKQVRFGAERLPNYSWKCHQLNNNKDTVEKLCNNTECEWNGQSCVTAEHRKFEIVAKHGSFYGSLIYTSLAFDTMFGHTERVFPAHAPYIIDVDIMNTLQDR